MPEDPIVSALGCVVRIDVSRLSESDAAEVRRVWADAAVPDGSPLPEDHLTVVAGGGVPLDVELSRLSQLVTLAVIEARRGQLWMLHAAGLADDEGRVVVLVGPSGKGKTTASRKLAAEWGYLSDETVGIASDGGVVAYRKPLSVIEKKSHVKAQRSPGELGLGALPEAPLRLAALVLLDRRPEAASVPVVEECDLGDVLEELIAQTSYIADLPNPLRTIAAHAAAVGGVHRVIYREAESLPAALAPLFRDPEAVEVTEATAGPRPAADLPGSYRGAYLDALPLTDPDRLALLQPSLPAGATFRLITGIGPELWRASDGVAADRLAAAAVAAYGEPEGLDLAAAVASAAAELVGEGVLATEPTWRARADVARGSGPTPMALEGSAAVVWEVLAASRGITFTHLVEAVAERVGRSSEQLAAEVRAFLATLEAAELVERIAP